MASSSQNCSKSAMGADGIIEIIRFNLRLNEGERGQVGVVETREQRSDNLPTKEAKVAIYGVSTSIESFLYHSKAKWRNQRSGHLIGNR